MATETIKPKTWKDLGLRFVTALAMAGFCFVPFYFGGIYWIALVLALGARVIWEWVGLTDKDFSPIAYIIPVGALLLSIYFFYDAQYDYILPVVGGAAILGFLERLRRSGDKYWAPIGVFYTVLPCLALIWLRGGDVGASDGFKLLLYAIMVVISADVFAYLGGSYFKGPKLVPKLSPKKTWSGLISGILGGVAMGAAWGVFLDMGVANAAMLAFPIVVISVIGDFFESAVKRRMNVKDTGGILPGHGGLLDRLDSTMMVMIVALFLQHFWPLHQLA